jgi:nucleoid-associated protein YgaU
MPPRARSRHIFSLGVRDEATPDELELTEREPFVYRSFTDNRQHTVEEGDTLWTLAARYFSPMDSAANLWWVIADFQPDPIHDPTIALVPGTVLVIPSVRTVLENVFDENRRLEGGA